MGERYNHLSWRERLTIETRLKDGWSKQRIADALGRHVSTIYREIKRGWGQQRTSDLIDYECYLADIAQARYEAEYSGKGPALKIGKDHEYANYLGSVLKNGNRSPEAALGEIQAQGMIFETTISTRTLYRYITLGIIPGVTNKDLPIKRDKKRKHKKVRRASRACPGLSIEQRPAAADSREEPGHWEGDTVESKKGALTRIFKLTERTTRQEITVKVASGEAANIVKALDRLERKLGNQFYTVFKSITVDNGSEFADCEGMERSCRRRGKRTTIYYCHPYSSFEKGSTEKQNGMIRRHHPKGTDFSKVSTRAIKNTEEWINHYPRKMFNFHSSAEMFAAIFPEAALALSASK